MRCGCPIWARPLGIGGGKQREPRILLGRVLCERAGLQARLITGRARASPTGSSSCRARHALRARLSPGPFQPVSCRARVVLINRASCRANGLLGTFGVRRSSKTGFNSISVVQCVNRYPQTKVGIAADRNNTKLDSEPKVLSRKASA
jgi:hypothetical protein